MTEQELKRIEELNKEYKTLKPYRDRFYEVSFELEDLWKKKDEEDKRNKYWTYRTKLNYVPAEYPQMGSEGQNGCIDFTDQKEAEEFVQFLVSESSYTYGYELEWSGPGFYVVEPSYRTDHDNDIIYTATFRKQNE